MQIELTSEQEKQIVRIAAQEGRSVDDVASELFGRFLDDEARFIAAVRLGEAELDHGDYVSHQEVGALVRRLRAG
jgi:predicted transcriptional regulator